MSAASAKMPASSPCSSVSADGLPLGLQVMGFAGEDAGLFGIAAAIRDLLASAR